MDDRRMDGKSFDNGTARIAALKAMFPEAVKEGRFDLDALTALLEDGDEPYALNEERYDFTWNGKAESLKLAQRRSTGTLRPDQSQSRDWETTGNLYIEGDNLEVMKLLQQGYLRKVKLIYIDPPYNTGNDFVYEDDFADPIAQYKEATGQGMRANPETAGRYHSRWLSMMYPRLKIAKTLLRDDGMIFISIDDHEQANLKKLCDEVFGEENHLGTFIWHRRQMADSRNQNRASTDHEYVLAYSRPEARLRGVEIDKGKYTNPDGDPRGDWFSADLTGLANKEQRPNLHYDVVNPKTGLSYPPNPTRGWSCSRETMQRLIEENRVLWPNKPDGRPRQKKFLSDIENTQTSFSTVLEVGFTTEGTRIMQELFEEKIFSFPKPVSLIKSAVEQATTDDDIILDFFAGSSTTAQAVMEQNLEDGGKRRFILVQIPESVENGPYATIADIGKERIRRAGERILATWHKEHDGQLPLGDGEAAPAPPDVGFRVFRLDSSNWQPWDDSYVAPEQADLFAERLDAALDNVKPDRREIDLVYEVCLKYGVPLTERISTLEVEGKRFYIIGARARIFLCLDKDLAAEVVEAAAEHCPGVMIFSDQSFTSINEMTNAGLSLEKANIEFRLI